MARRPLPSRVSPGRLTLLGIVGAYFVLLLALGGHHAWWRLGVPASPYSFLDLRSVTSGWDCTRRGIAVLAMNPCDPNLRPANYPSIWMAPSVLGLGVGSTDVLGVLIAIAFFAAAVAVLPAGARTLDAVAYGVALCSPAVMLGVERGNVDILVFAIVALAVLVYRRGQRSLASHALILFAAVLKLYPIFAVGWLIRRWSRRAALGLVAVVAAFVVYALAILGEIRTIQRVTPEMDTYSYGIRIFVQWLAAGGDSVARRIGAGSIDRYRLGFWSLGLAVLTVRLLLLARRRLRAQLGEIPGPAAQRDLDLFVAGAGIYVASYALFRSFDYRLAFLLLTLPQCLRWARERRPLAYVVLVALFATLWLDSDATVDVPWLGSALAAWNRFSTFPPFDRPLPLAVAGQFVLFASLVACLIAVAPTWGGGPERAAPLAG